MITVQNEIGRLIEVRMAAPYTLDDIKQFIAAFQNAIKGVIAKGYPGFIAVGDMRSSTLFTPEQSEILGNMLQQDNPLVLRSSFLMPEHPIFGFQVDRLLKDAKHPYRRFFSDIISLTDWMAEVATIPERARLSLFLQQSTKAMLTELSAQTAKRAPSGSVRKIP